MIAAGAVFGTGHIALTGGLSGIVAAAVALLLLRGRGRVPEAAAVGLLTAATVFLLRRSANLPQLNDDGLPGFSANDWLAPIAVFVVLRLYAAVRPAGGSRRFDQVCAAATLGAFVLNVVTI